MLRGAMTARPVDLRSDTVTRPSPEMRRAMAEAEVGDDVFGEDPTAQRLEARTAELLGKEAALFVPSGTMANQLALLLHCRRGDAVVLGEGTHCMVFETGGAAATAGVQFSVAGQGGPFTAAECEKAILPAADWFPRARLVVLENTHNVAGGRVLPQAEVVAVAEVARRHGLAVHLDGARLWNAATASGLALDVLARPADSVSVCFSKGLGAPLGSALVGSRDFIKEARRYRKMLGGGMRQVGIVCAAALYALEHHREGLAQDHALAQTLAKGLAQLSGVSVDVARVETNIVNIDVPAAREVARRLAAAGVLINATGDSRLRAVTHRDVGPGDIALTLEAFRRVL
jgi:threonine aldolase